MSKDNIVDMANEVIVAVADTAKAIDKSLTPSAAPTAVSLDQRRIMGILGDIGATPGCDVRHLGTWPEATLDELFVVLSRVLLATGRNRVLAREALAIDRDLFYGWLSSASFIEWEKRLANNDDFAARLGDAARRRIGQVLSVEAQTDVEKQLQVRTALAVVRGEQSQDQFVIRERRLVRQADQAHERDIARADADAARLTESAQKAAARRAEAEARKAEAEAKKAQAELERFKKPKKPKKLAEKLEDADLGAVDEGGGDANH